MFEQPAATSDRRAITAQTGSRKNAVDAPKPRRSRAKPLTRVDRRSALGRRIEALTEIYLGALGGSEALSPLKRLKIIEAAELKALAELARGKYLRDCEGSLDDVIRVERKASAAERALGIVDKPAAQPTLAEYLAATAEDAPA